MAFTVPIFNLLGDRWIVGKLPSTDPPDFEDIPMQKYVYSKGMLDIQPSSPNAWVPPIYLRMDKSEAPWTVGDIVECPVGLNTYYKVRWKELCHEGFPNEYYQVLVEQCTDAGVTPIP